MMTILPAMTAATVMTTAWILGVPAVTDAVRLGCR